MIWAIVALFVLTWLARDQLPVWKAQRLWKQRLSQLESTVSDESTKDGKRTFAWGGFTMRLGATLPVELHISGEWAIPPALSIQIKQGDWPTAPLDFFETFAMEATRQEQIIYCNHKIRAFFTSYPEISLREESLHFTCDDRPQDDKELTTLLDRAADLAVQFRAAWGDGDRMQRLHHNSVKEPEVAHQLQALELMRSLDNGNIETQHAAQEAIMHESLKMRCLGASILGKSGLPTMYSLLQMPELTESLRMPVLSHIAAHEDDRDAALALLCQTIRDLPEDDTLHDFLCRNMLQYFDQQMCIDAFVTLAKDGAFATPESLLNALSTLDPKAHEDCLTALLGAPVFACAPALHKWLGDHANESALLATLVATAKHLELTKTQQQMFTHTIQQLQQRLNLSQDGYLSITEEEDDRGGLSLMDADGELSLTD